MTKLHKRCKLDRELEKIKDGNERWLQGAYNSIDITSGQSRGVAKQSWFSSMFAATHATDESGQESTVRTVGQFKGALKIEETIEKGDKKNKSNTALKAQDGIKNKMVSPQNKGKM